MAVSRQQTIAPQAHIIGLGDDNGEDSSELDSLGDLVRNYDTSRVEERKKVKVEHTSNTISAIEQFREVLNGNENAPCYLRDKLDKTMTTVLTPREIGIVFQAMHYETEDQEINTCKDDNISAKIGVFASKLIQNSYDAGNNGFVLCTTDSPRTIGDVVYRLNGNKKQMIKIKIIGDTNHLCSLSTYCDVDVDGNLRFSNLDTGFNSKHCILTFRDKVPDFGYFIAENSIYKTTDLETLEVLIRQVLQGAYNQIVFINPNGSEDAILQYAHDTPTEIYVNSKYYEHFQQIKNSFKGGIVRGMGCKSKIIVKDDLQIKPID